MGSSAGTLLDILEAESFSGKVVKFIITYFWLGTRPWKIGKGLAQLEYFTKKKKKNDI